MGKSRDSKKAIKKAPAKTAKEKKQKRDLKKLIDNYAQGSGSGGSINELIFHKKKWYKDILNETPLESFFKTLFKFTIIIFSLLFYLVFQ